MDHADPSTGIVDTGTTVDLSLLKEDGIYELRLVSTCPQDASPEHPELTRIFSGTLPLVIDRYARLHIRPAKHANKHSTTHSPFS